MHSALLIDEILRLIFSFASECGPSTLAVAAQCCKAWHDPALDFLWNRLSSFKPFLIILSGGSMVNGEFVLPNSLPEQDLARFNFYAGRIKHASNRHGLRVCFGAEAMLFLQSLQKVIAFPNLSSTHISVSRCPPVLIPSYFSSNLTQIDFDLGFKASPPSTDDQLCAYFTRVAESCRGLQHLSLRGHASERLNDIISRLSGLHSISLKLGTTLSPKTLKAVMDFPHLSEMEVHAGHIEFYDVNDKREDYSIFTSLRKLHIRAQSTLIQDILQHIPSNTLRYIHLELDDLSSCTTFWDVCFSAIANKSGETLQHLALEHHFEIVEPPLSIPLDATQPSNTSITGITAATASTVTSHMTFQVVETLRVLRHLRYFSCDITLLPLFTDKDIERMVTWWPVLQHFELGSSPRTEELEDSRRPQMTPGCLHSFASQLSQLRKLMLPLTIDDNTNLSVNIPLQRKVNQLQSLTIAQLSTTSPDGVARYLHTLFPSLRNLEGPCDDGDIWIETLEALRNLAY